MRQVAIHTGTLQVTGDKVAKFGERCSGCPLHDNQRPHECRPGFSIHVETGRHMLTIYRTICFTQDHRGSEKQC